MIARDVQSIGQLRSEWEFCRERFGCLVPNTNPDRYLGTVTALGVGVTPHIAVLPDGAGCVIARERVRREKFRLGYLNVPAARLRCLEVVYEGLIVAPDESAYLRLSEYITAVLRDGIDLITINHLRTDSVVFRRLADLGAVADPSELHWVLPLCPGSIDSTLQHRSGKHRGNLRRMDKKLCDCFSGDVRIAEYSTTDQVGPFIELASAIAAASYHGAIGAGVADTALWRAILLSEAAAGRWRAFALIARGKAIAYATGVLYESTFFLEATSFRPELRHLGPGTVLLMRLVADLCGRQVARIDFGFGDAEYKRSNAKDSWAEATVRIYSRRLGARWSRLVGAVTTRISRNSVAREWDTRVKKVWRRLLISSNNRKK